VAWHQRSRGNARCGGHQKGEPAYGISNCASAARMRREASGGICLTTKRTVLLRSADKLCVNKTCDIAQNRTCIARTRMRGSLLARIRGAHCALL